MIDKALKDMFGIKASGAEYQTTQLHGGTLGDVKLLTGTALTEDGETLPFKLVWKTQKKWERYADPLSWRREYDVYTSDLGRTFTEALRWPKCYHAEINANEDEIQLWMEYIDGTSGLDLTADMYVQAAAELGRWQGRLYAEKHRALEGLTNLNGTSYQKDCYLHYRSWNVVYDYVRSAESELPKHICDMFIELDRNSDGIWGSIEKLPVVLCHRDFWVTNIFHTSDGIRLIDWDTAGWGYFGEDMASLIADEADIPNMVDHYKHCVPAYYGGFSEYADVSGITDYCVYELILFIFGYRIVEDFIYADKPETKALRLETLQKIYEMRDV
jgi:tRNA A-37 threonylcarbamoyl transferase component Bud32